MAEIRIFDDARELSRQAADYGAEVIRQAIRDKGRAVIVLATGSSQIEMLSQLVQMPDIDWSAVTVFHLDEYIGLARTHKASFRHYLQTRFVAPLKVKPIFHTIDGEGDPAQEIERLGRLIRDEDIDLCFAGIGNNCHLAFNDPPANFVTTAPYLVVGLDEVCRRQQVEGGWFDGLSQVPHRAITMSICQILKSRHILVLAQGARKADAVHQAIEGQISPQYPASVLQRHLMRKVIWFLDQEAGAQLNKNR